MIWLIFAVLTALFESLKGVFSKKSLKGIDEYVVSWSLMFFALIFLAPLLLFIEIPALGGQFWIALIVGGLLGAVATVLYMKAIKESDLSLAVPMLTFTPLFLLITSPLILGEFPRSLGLAGILFIVAGSYSMNIKKMRDGYLEPFKALLKEKGPRLMLIVAFIWSITSNIDKIGVQNSSPIFWVIAVDAFLAIILFPIMLYKSPKSARQVSVSLKALVPIGLFSALTSVFQMTALSLTLVAYVISIKRTSAVISVIFGYLIFKEKRIRERLFGAALMVLGVLLIALS